MSDDELAAAFGGQRVWRRFGENSPVEQRVWALVENAQMAEATIDTAEIEQALTGNETPP